MQTQFSLPNTASTVTFAETLAAYLKAGDTLLLSGPVGAGKSFFSRALVRSFCGPGTEVPSPSFSLLQTYECSGITILHLDLFRIVKPDAVIELGLDAVFETAISLVEWPEMLGRSTPKRHLAIAFLPDAKLSQTRHVQVTGVGEWPWLPDVLAALRG